MKFLIVQCEELGDQWECDVNRTPRYITDDWKTNYPIDYPFEVYEILDNGQIGNRIKDYEDGMSLGMVFGYWKYYDNTEEFHAIKYFPNAQRSDECPKDIYKKLKSLDCFDNSLTNCGYISGEKSENEIYIYGEYIDSKMPTPF